MHQNFMLCEAQNIYNLHNKNIYELKEVFVFFLLQNNTLRINFINSSLKGYKYSMKSYI